MLNIFSNIVNDLQWFYLMHVKFLWLLTSKSSWLISYYPVNVNISQLLIIFIAGNDNSWLMLTLAA
jgi:hypothetical protein